MHNLTATIGILRDAETIIRSRLITDKEERRLLAELETQLPVEMLPSHSQLIISAIARYNGRPRKGPFDPNAVRPTEGQQDAAPVATGPGEAPAETPQGPTAGEPEQAENAGVVANGSDERPAPTETTPAPKGPKTGPKRR